MYLVGKYALAQVWRPATVLVEPSNNICLQPKRRHLSKFQKLLATSSLVEPTDDGGCDPCCPWKFYACVTLCAATIEAFPTYLLCCAFCYDTYCCK